MPVELVRTVTSDGLRLDGALAETVVRSLREGNAAPSAAIFLHGVAGNFYTSSTFDSVVPKLREIGMTALSVNTRGHDSVFSASLGNVRRRFGAAYETVADCRQDIAAWIDFLKRRGHERIALVGHSLGAIKAVFAQAHDKHPEVAAVVAASPPRLSYAAFMNSSESGQFFESMNTAQQMVKDGRGEDLFTATFPFPLLIAASAYLDKYGPAERYNLLNFAADLPCPALFTYGSKELTQGGIAFADLPSILIGLPNAERRQVAVIKGADHLYTGVGEQLGNVIAAWLRGLPTTSLSL